MRTNYGSPHYETGAGPIT